MRGGKKLNNAEISDRLRLLAAKLETAVPLITGTDAGRQLARQVIMDAAAELAEISDIVAGAKE